jgi:HK97 family phage prohead protease
MIVSRTIPVIKALADGRFEGLAWSFATTPDTEGDILLPSALAAAAKSVPIPVLIEHRGRAVGEIQAATVTEEGLSIRGQLDTSSDTGREAYALVKSGELQGLSMGFAGEAEQSGPVRVFRSARIDEISICRAPINSGSRVTAVKAWSEIGSERDLERVLKATGMPNRLASKCAAAAWPVIQHNPNPDTPADLVEALRRLAKL